ncbi:MAG: sulfite exporter TauE/SafE family protein [Flavobacteriaceae bacterium]|nr:sulfite exporter TauE/SafE family protein [Flavobacteriaceae bacterium]
MIEFIIGLDVNILWLILAGFAAGFINTIAGGGTLLTLPALIFMGLPPSIANGTNRIAIFLQTAAGVAGFKSKGVTTFPFSIYCGLSALLGALIGAKIAVDIKGETFNKILAVIMIIVVLLIIFKPKLKAKESLERTTGKFLWIAVITFFFLGIYGGFINAGIGFLMLIFMPYVNRMSLLRANAAKVTIVCIYTFGAIIMFYLNDKINWKYGLILSIGNVSGAWISSRWSVKKDDNMIQMVLIVMIIVMAIKLWFF